MKKDKQSDFPGQAAPLSEKPATLAICCVYICKPGLEWLIELQLEMISRNTDVDFRIFAAVVRSSPETLSILQSNRYVKVVEVPRTALRGAAEHGHYLDALVKEACREDFTHIATFDPDSFPVKPGWFTECAKCLTDERPLAAVLRLENGDTALPHPSGLIFRTDFYRRHRPPFYPSGNSLRRSWYGFYYGQRVDTGFGYMMAIRKANLDWTRLTRSNRTEDHWLLGALYGGMFFHLGAMSRAPLFFKDWHRPSHRLIRLGAPFRITRRQNTRLSKEFEDRNRVIFDRILAQLSADPIAYFERLNGGPLRGAPQDDVFPERT